jgi:hypothetical protein
MGFFRNEKRPDWIDAAPFAWVPEQPLHAEPGFSPGAAGRIAEPPATPANSNKRPGLLGLRLGIGLAQGLGFYILFHLRGAGLWPGSDPYLFAGLALAGLFAPQLVLEGLDEIPPAILAAWASAAASLAIGLGFYHHWRIQAEAQGHAGVVLILLVTLLLFNAQALLHAALRRGGIRAALPEAQWTLAARLLIWLAVAGLAWALIGSGNGLLNWLRPRYPMLHIGAEPALIGLPLVGVAGAAAWHLAVSSRLPRACRTVLATCFTIALPLLAVAAAVSVAVHLFVAAIPAGFLLALGWTLTAAFTASARGETRARWRRIGEACAVPLIVVLAALAGLAIASRVIALGWSDMRIYAAITALLLAAAGLGYGAGLLVGLGGRARAMRQVHPLLALLVIAACVALLTPLGDPLRLAARSQTDRLTAGDVRPWQFDFGWLRRHGGRFGQAALRSLARDPEPEIARDAALFLSLAPGLPTPTMIGANIHVRSLGARLPATLLETDWSKVNGPVPPCLTGVATGCDAWFLDFDNDGAAEILLAYGDSSRWWAAILKPGAGGWRIAGTLAAPPCPAGTAAMRAGDFTLVKAVPAWRDLLVSGMRLHVTRAGGTPPCPK